MQHSDIASILGCVRDSAEEGEKLRTDPRIEISKGIIAKAHSDLLFNGELHLTLEGQSYVSGDNWRVYDKKEGLKIVRKIL
jgi:predicted ATP-dependent protease